MTAVTVRALPAKCGDCLVVEYGSTGTRPYRILIDGGLKGSYDDGLGRYLAESADQPTEFDIVVVTHIDLDHIEGVIEALAANALTTANIWFNGRDQLADLIDADATDRGHRQGDALDKLIPPGKRNPVVDGKAIYVPEAGVVEFDDLPGSARCTVLSPSRARLDELLAKWPKPTRGDAIGELFDAFDDSADADRADTRAAGVFGRDGSVANGSSIALLLEIDDVALLFTGDAYASELESAIGRLLAQRGVDKLHVDLFKLSHHGSRQNMTDGLLDLIEPATILVCTDGSKFKHPDADALAKIRTHYPDVPIRFTDATDVIVERATSIGVQAPTPDQLPVALRFGADASIDTPPPAASIAATASTARQAGTTATRSGSGKPNGVGIRGENLNVKLEWVDVAGGGLGTDGLSAVLASHRTSKAGSVSVELVAQATIDELEQTSARGRSGVESGELIVDLARPDADEARIVMIEENGLCGWYLPARGADEVVLTATLGASPGRGRVTSLVRRTLRVISLKGLEQAAGGATRASVGAYEQARHPSLLRTWSPGNYATRTAEVPDLARFDRRNRSLLVIHGFMGSIESSFGFSEATVRRLGAAYNDRMIAFDHPTMAVTPRRNAEDLLERLGGHDMTLDILAHSRGGLVARELARLTEGSKIDIRSIVFVATPNCGTPLADPDRPTGLLDGVTNFVGNAPGTDGYALVLEMLADVALGGGLPGLEGLMAMQPGGDYLTELNKHPTPEHIVLRAIAAEYEPAVTAGFLQTKYDDALDTYFGETRNDRIVPTASAYVRCGGFQVRPGQRLVLDASRGVEHSSFWTDSRATRQLLTWLSADEDVRTTPEVPEAETDPEAETASVSASTSIESIIDSVQSLPDTVRKKIGALSAGAAETASPPTGQRDAVILLPGVLGSNLTVDGRAVWVDALRLARGGLGDLAFDGAGKVNAVGLNRSYIPLITRLARSWDVHLFAYDWRDDIVRSANRLDELVGKLRAEHPHRGINFVAHSMGGLVARAFIAEHRQRWDELAEIGGASSGRLVMLGTPNRGSYATPLVLLGHELTVRAIVAIDRKHSVGDIGAIVAGFPGIYQMLPFAAGIEDDNWSDLYDVASWGDGAPVRAELLALARDTHVKLAEKGVDAGRFCYVAGYGKDTPYRVTIGEGREMRIGQFAMGDGRVAHRLGELDDMAMFFVDATHGGLISSPVVLDKIDDLIRDGTASTTDRFLATAPARRGAGGQLPRMLAIADIDRQPLAPVTGTRGGALRPPTSDDRRVLDDAMTLVLGGESGEPRRSRINVRVVHASLEQTRYPVAVGHYARLPADGAEGFLDWKLGGVLNARYRLGLIPDDPGRALVVCSSEGQCPGGALVAGLGEFGLLTESVLTKGIADGVLRLARMRIEAHVGVNKPFGLAAVLIGTPGRFGLEIETSMVAIIEGVMGALGRLGGDRPDEFDLEFIELYEQRADDAAKVLSTIRQEIDHNLLSTMDLDIAEMVERRDGGRPGAPTHNTSGRPWIRVQASLEPPDPAKPSPISEITVSVLTRQAQADKLTHQVDLDKISDYVSAAIDSSVTGSVGHTLYELVLPHRVKLDLGRSENIHLLVDEQLGQLPWELIAARDTGGKARGALALRAGFLRQLHSEQLTRQGSVRPTGRHALVIGDPPTSFGRLPGARREAGEVAELLKSADWDVSEHISQADDEAGSQWIEIDNLLHAAPYRVVHVAAHGIFEPDEPNRSGVVTGPGPHHRLTALDFRSMSVQPDLVFLNCCHLGRLEAGDDEKKLESWLDPRQLRQPHRLAATVATQLMQNGVKAVVVAGWEVDDQAAAAFADRLYRCLLDAEPFGDAVRKARTAAFDVTGETSNTWGAYQCYGDPDFQLVTGSRPSRGREPIVSDNQLIKNLQILTGNAGQADDDEIRKLAEELENVVEAAGDRLGSAHVTLAIGDAYRSVGQFKKAAEWYERCFLAPDGRGELRAIEQYTNMLVRDAAHADPVDIAPFGIATKKLEAIVAAAGETAGRLSLLGSVYKGLAVVLSRHPEATFPPGSTLPTTAESALDLATANYKKASDITLAALDDHPDIHCVNTWLQLEYATSNGNGDRGEHLELGRRLLDLATPPTNSPTDFWDRSKLGDTLLTMALLKHDATSRVDIGRASQEYVAAFENRSTIRERDAVRTHLDDLIVIADGLPGTDTPGLGLIKELRHSLPSS